MYKFLAVFIVFFAALVPQTSAFAGDLTGKTVCNATFDDGVPTGFVNKAKGKSTLNHKQVTSRAKYWLKFDICGRRGLITQLVYEGATLKSATSVVDGLKVKWEDVADRVAHGTVRRIQTTPEMLIQQLISQGFTSAEAKKAVKKIPPGMY